MSSTNSINPTTPTAMALGSQTAPALKNDAAAKKVNEGGKKYELIPLAMAVNIPGQLRMFQIRALRDIPAVPGIAASKLIPAGTVGGAVQGEYNLSQEGLCWIDNSACVIEEAVVSGDARVQDSATVMGVSTVSGRAVIREASIVGGDSVVDGNAEVKNSAVVMDSAVGDFARVSGQAKLLNYSRLADSAHVTGEAIVDAQTSIRDEACIGGNVLISAQNCKHKGVLQISGNPHIETQDDLDLFLAGKPSVKGLCEELGFDEFFKQLGEAMKDLPQGQAEQQKVLALMDQAAEQARIAYSLQSEADKNTKTNARDVRASSGDPLKTATRQILLQLKEGHIAHWLDVQIKNGNLPASEIPGAMARFALTEPQTMREELAGQMGLLRDLDSLFDDFDAAVEAAVNAGNNDNGQTQDSYEVAQP
jgi:hypothetical protein